MDAKKALSTISDAHLAFWFNNGVVVKSLKELAHHLDSIDQNVFHYHVNHDKNDIFNWVQDVFSDNVLAQSIKGELNSKNMARKIFAHIQELQSHVPAPSAAPVSGHSPMGHDDHAHHDEHDHDKKQMFKRK